MTETITFNRLQVEGWRQFDSVDIELHPRLTIITGSNGSGKSTLLNVFAGHFGFSRPLLSTPARSKSGGFDFVSSVFASVFKRFTRTRPQLNDIGTLKYSNDVQAQLHVPPNGGAQFNIVIVSQQPVVGMHVDSHRPTPRYQPLSQLPTSATNLDQAFNSYNSEIVGLYTGQYGLMGPMFRLKESLITMAIFGEGNKFAPGNDILRRCFEGFAGVLKKILPEELGFSDITIRQFEVVLITESGDFIVDAASGGVMALIDLAWRVHLFSQGKDSFVITMDEPENHLHPSMQRTLMRRFMSAFPQARFIIATHSPFIVSSVKDSFVYVLRYSKNEYQGDPSVAQSAFIGRRIYSERLDNVNKAGNASDILMEVLGVPATIPEWVEDGLQDVVREFSNRPIDAHMLNSLRERLASLGFSEMYPNALAALTRA